MIIKINMLWHRSVISCRRSLCLFARNGFDTKVPFNRSRIIASSRNAIVHHDAGRVVSYATSTDGNRSHYDVIISGGGMVGSSVAASLGHEPLFKNKKVLLLEEGRDSKITELPKEFNSRVCALSPATKKFLSSFGAWSGVEKRRFQPVKRMQIWDSCSDSTITFDQDSMEQDLAYIAENDVILAAIVDQLDKVKGENVEVRYETKVKSYNLPRMSADTGPLSASRSSNWAEVVLENGEVLSSKLIIGADGFNSLLRKTSKIHSVKWEYGQMAVVATLHLPEDTINNVAWQRFLPEGPIALLPLSNDASCLIWTTSPENAKSLVKLAPESFVDAVNNAFFSDASRNSVVSSVTQFIDSISNRIGFEQPIRQLPPTVMRVVDSSRKTFPLGLMHSTHYVKPRVALVGDAAHRVHPLAGQGVNLGFGDAACLTRLLGEAAYDGRDIGSLRHLLEYETERQRHVVPIMTGVDCLNRLYSTSFAPLVLLRSIGCQTTNSLQPIKEQMIKFATS